MRAPLVESPPAPRRIAHAFAKILRQSPARRPDAAAGKETDMTAEAFRTASNWVAALFLSAMLLTVATSPILA